MTKWEYLKPFVTTSESLHLLDISRQLNQNHSTVRKYLNDFEKEGILKKTTKGRLTLYSLNHNSQIIEDVLTLAEKEILVQKRRKSLILSELVYLLRKKTSKELIIFGSSTKDFMKSNDIDILTTDEKLKVSDISKKVNKKIHLLKVNSLEEVSETLGIEILKKHLILNNSESVVRWLISVGAKSKVRE